MFTAASLLFSLPVSAQMSNWRGNMGTGNGNHTGNGSANGGMHGGQMGGTSGNQMMADYGNGWHTNSDSLTEITVTGTVIIDSSVMNAMYYLDEDGDGAADYHISFGPYWYQPDSSSAVRPSAGEQVTIVGGLHDDPQFGMPVIIVYEINGRFWRDPFTPFWNNTGNHFNGGHMHSGNGGFGSGMMNSDSLVTVRLTGTALVDTTFFMGHIFLDENGDAQPDYFLNFGPPWFQPVSGAVRPQDGDTITVVGGFFQGASYQVVMVYEINGQVWRDSSRVGTQFGGGWIRSGMNQSRRIHSPFDSQDWMQFNPGWRQTGMGNHGNSQLPDSLFCQILEVYPQNIPAGQQQNHFAAYEIGIFYPDGHNGMRQGGTMGRMNFGSTVQFQFHYNDRQIQGMNLDENAIQVQTYNEQTQSWETVNDAVVDPVTNTVTLSGADVSGYVLLSAETTTGLAENSNPGVIDGFALKQNFPNPFNPETTIEFAVDNPTNVRLSVFNVIGQKVAELVNEQMNAGTHKVTFNAESLPSGIYFYELRIGSLSKIMKMSLLK